MLKFNEKLAIYIASKYPATQTFKGKGTLKWGNFSDITFNK